LTKVTNVHNTRTLVLFLDKFYHEQPMTKSNVEKFRELTNTPARRHTFYCYCTQKFAQDQAIFFLLVEAFRQSHSKRHAIFINDWFIKGNIPAALDGFVTQVNISSSLSKSVGKSVDSAVTAVGKTFSDKRANHGGGFGGFLGALRQKMGDTGLDADLFKNAQAGMVEMLADPYNKFDDTYKPDGMYQPNPSFSKQLILFRKEIMSVGFDAKDLGLY